MKPQHSNKSIYALVDPRDNRIRYVGQSFDPENRLKSHYSNPMISAKFRDWIYELRHLEIKPILKILQVCEICDAKEKEDFWIKYYHAIEGDSLLNSVLNVYGKHTFTIEVLKDEYLERLDFLRGKVGLTRIDFVKKLIDEYFESL